MTLRRIQPRGAKLSQSREELMCSGNVLLDLRSQFRGSGEFLFFSQSFPKPNLNTLCFELLRCIEQVRFHGERGAVECWPHADIGNRTAAFRLPVKQRSRDVNAVRRQKLLFGLEI